MFNYPQAMMAFSIAGLVLASYGGEFTLKKADHDLLLKKKIYAVDMLSMSLRDVKKSQEDETIKRLIDPKVALFLDTQRKKVRILVYKSTKEAKTFDHVIVDQNNDFSDDVAFDLDSNLSADIKIQTQSNEVKEYRVVLVSTPDQGCGWEVALLPVNWMEGSVTLARKPVRAVWMRCYMKRDRLMIDTDGDGAFSSHPNEDIFDVAPYLWINNAFYEVVSGKAENELDLKPFEGPLGQLMLRGEMIPPGTNISQILRFTQKEENSKSKPSLSFIVRWKGANQLIILPAGVYDLWDGYLANQENDRHLVEFSFDDVTVASHGVTTLSLVKAGMHMEVEQEDRNLRVSRVLTCEGQPSLTYKKVGGGEYSLPWVVDVVDAADPAKVIVGRTNMEYG